ncbi:enoyl reductase [Strigomonas culicis]|nr:enoyl reductase [Strigomonas culicis]EPY35966.1 enoyl reductase [Strigomonas culicis]|eukprot:EPY32648.1 enoyl reductase [Strigomonas culicis]
MKRELETFFVHKFSRPTMPFQNIFKNCTYYWTFAAFIGYVLCHPDYTAPSALATNIGAVVMVISEILNFAVHMQLSSMRKGDGDEARNTPAGPLFALVSCPNYLFEVLSWVGFSVGTSMFSAWFFTCMGLLQMTIWAQKKHAGYCKADAANKKKKAIIPFVI